MKFVVYSHTESFYGAPKSMLELTDMVVKNGYQVLYVLPSQGLFSVELEKRGYEVVYLPNPEWICGTRSQDYSRYYYIKHRIKIFLQFLFTVCISLMKHVKFLKSKKPDWVIVNTSVAPIGLYAGKLAGFRTILWVREPLLNNAGWIIPTMLPKTLVKNTLRLATITFGPSEYIVNYFKKTFKLDKVFVLSNPINTPANEFISVSPLKPIVFGLVGSLSERKGQIDFINEAIKKIDSCKVIVFGDGHQTIKETLFALQKKYPKKILLMGFEANISEIYNKFDVYVNMGIDETFGRTTVEAMRFQKLIFALRSGASPEIIEHGKTGFLFDNVSEIFEILERESHEKLFNEIPLAACIASSKYSPDKIANDFLKMINGF